MDWKYCCLFLTVITQATLACPPIVSRTEWNASAPVGRPERQNPWEFVVIHHTHGKNCFSNDTCHLKLQEMQRYHMRRKRWCDIGYNFLIGGDGTIYEGRGWEIRGQHVSNYNTRALGLALTGNFNSEPPPEAQIDAMKSLVLCGLKNNHLSPKYKVVGHRQLSDTCCPGKALQRVLKDMKNHFHRYCV